MPTLNLWWKQLSDAELQTKIRKVKRSLKMCTSNIYRTNAQSLLDALLAEQLKREGPQ